MESTRMTALATTQAPGGGGRGRRGSGRRRLRELTRSVVDTMELLEEVRSKHADMTGVSKALVQVGGTRLCTFVCLRLVSQRMTVLLRRCETVDCMQRVTGLLIHQDYLMGMSFSLSLASVSRARLNLSDICL